MVSAAVLAILGILVFVDGSYGGDVLDRGRRDREPSKIINKLRKDLFANYDSMSRPVLDNSKNISVQVAVQPILLTELDEKRGIMIMETWLKMGWNDVHLKWRPEDYEGIKVLRVMPTEVWKPDITVYEGRGGEIDPFHNVMVLLYNTGALLWVPPATVHSICNLKYTNFPRDTQHCSLTLGSWTYSGYEIDLEMMNRTNLWTDLMNTNPQWKIQDVKIHRKSKIYECCKEPYISVVTNFTLVRRASFGETSTTVPRAMAVILTLLMFWISRDLGKKLMLGCASSIILTAVTIYSCMTVPSVTALPYVLCRPSAALILTVLAMIIEVVISALVKCVTTQPPWLKWVLHTKVSKYALCHVNASSKHDPSVMVSSVNAQDDSYAKTESDLLLTACDRTAFIIFLILALSTCVLW